MTTTTEPIIEPQAKERTLDHWPPVVHITEDLPVRPGCVALCGEKLMGIDVGTGVTCRRCLELAKEAP